MEVVADIRREQNMFTYPVLTYSLLKRNDFKDGEIEEMIKTREWDVFVDKDFAKWCSDHNIEWSDSNFFCSDNVGILSNCPLSGDTKVLFWSDYYNKFILSTMHELYFNSHRESKEKYVKVISDGKMVECKINQFSEVPNYEIVLANGAKLNTTADHLNIAYGKNYVKTKDLTTEDYLPYYIKPFSMSETMSYEEGKIIGMFIGDGSYRNNSEVVFSLNRETDSDDIEFITNYCTNKYAAVIRYDDCISKLSGDNKCVNIGVNSIYLRGLISQFVDGDNALNKKLNLRVIGCSMDFRNGIIDGIQTTDGSNEKGMNRLYTSSEDLKDSLVVLLASMGLVTNVTVDTRDGRLGTNPNYCIRIYRPGNRTKLKDIYFIEDNYMWFKIKSITKVDISNTKSYCMEVIGDNEPVFMLGNGIITHNCRLLSDTTKLDAFINSIGGTALSVGSCRVSTINLVRIAYESEFDQKKYLKLLKQRVLLDCKALYSMRHILKRNIEKGLLPNYQDGAVELSKQFCTIGGIGMYEVMDLFGLINTDELGCKSYSDEAVAFATRILDTINEVKDNFECDFTFNVEMIPAENCAGVICTADNLLFEQNKYFIYSNQWIPLMEKCTIQEKCRLGSLFDEKCGGGCIAHINIENRFANEEMAWDMLNYVAAMGVIYFAFTTKISVCKNKHAFISEKTCPQCGEPIADTYARVVGFYVPISSYQKIRKKEFDKRRWMNVLLKDGIMQ